MKALFATIAVLLLCGAVRAEVDLEIVWQKYVYPTRISHAKWSADGRYIYCAVGNTIQKMDAANGEWLSVFDNTNIVKSIYDMKTSLNNSYLLTYGGGSIHIWDIKQEKLIKQVDYGTEDLVRVISIEMSIDGNYYIAGVWLRTGDLSWDAGIIQYDINLDKEIKRVKLDSQPWTLSMSHDGRYFVTGSVYEKSSDEWRSKLTLWDAQTFEQIAVLEDVGTGSSLVEYVILKMSKDAKYLAAITWNPYETRIFDLETKKLILKEGAYFGFDFMPDSYYYVGFRGDPVEKNIVELNSLDKKIKNYIIQDGNPESWGNKDNWKVFFGKMDSIYLMVNKPVGVEEKSEQEAIFNIITESGKVILKFEQPIIAGSAKVSIYDIVGKIVFSEAIEQIPADGTLRLKAVLGSGVYICKLLINGQEFSQKFQIVR